MEFSLFPQPVGLLKFMLRIFHTISIQWREHFLGDCIEYTFSTGLCRDSCEVICFRCGMIVDTTELYSMIIVWMTLAVTQG